ncbi:hypothetical protein [Photobacterium sp. 1_MG-2023]|uniref:hypothetical protein n=1 Tax=Photobacterium sp. 1_MG-2023 TaxID=3062646 RepID=UPI0026E46E8A|nr:hypothetical protein [Photobacterium sp. 1_MG-2023]MDO6704927.1 hypothetical protein [Photobacterium sp. 1_MG-2023]
MNDWQEPLMGIMLCSVVSLTTAVQCALSPERLFQVTQVVQTQEEDVWTQLFDTTALARLSESDSPEQTGQPLSEQTGQPLWPRTESRADCPEEMIGQQVPCLSDFQEATGVQNMIF